MYGTDMPYRFSVKSKMVFDQLYKMYEKGDKKVIERLLDAAESFPEVPHFLNLAALYYDAHDSREKAGEINKLVEEKFPSFLFWRVNKSLDAYLNEDAATMKVLLGDDLRLENLEPARKIFHFSEYVAYTRSVLLYYGLMKDYTSIVQRWQEARRVSGTYDFDITILDEAAYLYLKDLLNLKKSSQASLPSIPVFNFKETEEFFGCDLHISDEVFNSLLKKDRALVIQDLEKVLEYAIENEEAIKGEENLPDENSFFVLHAVFLLQDCEATESLPALLRFLKQDESTLDFYLGDVLANSLWQVFYTLGKDELRLLVDVFKELEDEWQVRTNILESLKQIVFIHPEKRLEIESYLRELLLYVSDKTIEDDIYIEDINDYVLTAIGEAKFERLFADVQRLLKEDSLPTIEMLSWEDFEELYAADEYDPSLYRREFLTRKDIYQKFLDSEQDEDDEEFDGFDLEDPDEYLRLLDENDAADDATELVNENEDE